MAAYSRHVAVLLGTVRALSPLQVRSPLHCSVLLNAGHNKWSKIKRPKMAADLERSKLITKLCAEITFAVKQGGDNPEHNLRLASVLSRAKKASIPKSTISSAIEAASSKGDGGEALTMIGRGLSGSYSIIIEAITNNKRRTRPEIKSILSKHGAELVPGTTSFEFTQKGIVLVSEESISEEAKALELAIIIEAEDVHNCLHEKCYKFLCDPKDMRNVIAKAEEKRLEILKTRLEYIASTTVTLTDEQLETAGNMIETLKNHDEVTEVYHNINNFDEQQ